MRVVVVVRSKKDRDVMEHVVDRYFSDWKIDVVSLGGCRRCEEVREKLLGVVSGDPSAIYIVFVGREDSSWLSLDREFGENVVFHAIRTARVRNCRMRELADELFNALSRFRMRVKWVPSERGYFIGKSGGAEVFSELNPTYDVFLAVGDGFRELLSEVIGRDVGANPLILKLGTGLHRVYSGDAPVAEIDFERGPTVVKVFESGFVDVSFDATAKLMYTVGNLKVLEEAAVRAIREFAGGDRVAVPWSGGKDSTVALVLAVKALGKDRVVPIYVDTGLEFDETREYIERIASRLGIDYEVAYAGIDRELPKRELPTRENRWCTHMKIAALYRKLEEVKCRKVVVGDRDTESLLRMRRAFERRHERYLQIAPIKLWSTLHVQSYLRIVGLDLNPLYKMGFYRIGCWMCPALRDWEIEVVMKLKLAKYYTRLKRLYEEKSVTNKATAA